MKTFDELFNQLLTDYRNQFPEADVSQGSLIYIKAAVLASALWGVYKYQEDYVRRQIFPDTADPVNLDHHAWVRGLTRLTGETDQSLLARVLDDIRHKNAGGNKYDYVTWAESIDGVEEAYCFPLAQGRGTVDVVVVASSAATGSEIPSLSARVGTATSAAMGKLIDSTAAFTTSPAVAVGDVVRNTVQGTEAVVVTVDSPTQLTLSSDIFRFVSEQYHVFYHTGAGTSVTAGKLVDSAGDFQNATYAVKKGDVVKNRADGTEAVVVSVDSGTQLTLDSDIFTGVGKSYVVESLITRVKEYIDSVRPVTASRVYVLGPTIVSQAVTLDVLGESVNQAQLAADVAAYINALLPGQTLYRTQLVAIAIQNGAENVDVIAPVADVTPVGYQVLRAGTVTIT